MKKKTQRTVARITQKRIIVSVRKAINDRLKELNLNPHWLATTLKIRPATMYAFLSKPGATMRTDKVERIFEALGLEIRPKGKRP